MVLEQAIKYLGLNQMVHGVSSQMAVDGFHGLLFMTTPFTVSEVSKQFGPQALLGVPGPKSPLLKMLLIWLTGMDDCMLLG